MLAYGMTKTRDVEVASSGFRPLDRLLPQGGLARGCLVDWLCDDDVSGGATLACAVGVSLAAGGGTLVVVDRGGRFHPPAVMPWLSGNAATRGQLIVARPARDDDEVWAIDQCLRCPGVAAVVAWPSRVHPTAMRRWQVAARSSQAVGLFMRPRRARREPSWAMHRIAVTPLPGGSLTVRWLRLAHADGPWSHDGIVSGASLAIERMAEVALDLTTGREAIGTDRRRQDVPPASCDYPPVHRGDVTCRAS